MKYYFIKYFTCKIKCKTLRWVIINRISCFNKQVLLRPDLRSDAKLLQGVIYYLNNYG